VALLIGGADLAEPAKRRHKAMLAELLKSSITGLAAWWFDHPEVSREELVDAVIGLGLQQQAGHSFGARVKKRWAYQRAPAGA
jgi:phosphate/sulfate permease